jgi:hypothetical protein
VSSNAIGWLVAIPLVLIVTLVIFISDEEGWSAGLTLGVSFGILAVVIGGFVTWFLIRKRKRAAAMPRMAARLGLQTQDPVVGRAAATLPFELFGRGSDRTVENVIGAKVGERILTMFDYSYSQQGYNPTTSSSTEQSFDFSCALIDVPASIPFVSVTREGFFSKIARAVGAEDVEVGDPSFDRVFKVKASDPGVARELLHPQMQAWLLSLDDRWNFEVAAGWLLCYSKQLPVEELAALHEVAWGFNSAIPRALLERFPATSR